uniref:TIGR02680 family protein n=1 Tax=Rhodococcus phenolicus TaxID=263849 RepID=UPI00082DCA55
MSSARFRPTRAGIINLWDYRDQEFSFADGRLVLRGPNGSGKTKALEVLFPFVFDGRIEPRRLNPFAGEERTMRSNLLYRGQDSAYSYVWMEFCRGDRDDPEAVTVGIGMRATRGNDKVTRWYFVVDGRVGVDFSLLDAEDRPLTRKQLIDEVGSDAVSDRPVDYRAAIDARLFGLGAQRYDQLINLILTLRRPQLAKNLDPKGLSQALTDGLRPLDDQLVFEAARSFSDMEEVARVLEGLSAADEAAQRFVTVYGRYLRQQARADVEQVAARLTAVDAGVAALHGAAADRLRSGTDRATVEQQLADTERELEQARANLEALQRSSAYEGKQQLDDLAQAVANLERTTVAQGEQARRAQAALAQRTEDTERAAAAVTAAVAALTRGEAALAAAAEDAGIAWIAPDPEVRAEQLATAIDGRVTERESDVQAVRSALSRVEGAASARTRAESSAQRGRAQLDTARASVEAAGTMVELARAEAANQLRTWWGEHGDEYSAAGVANGLLAALDDTIARAGDDDAPAPAVVLAAHTASAVEEVKFRRRSCAADAEALEARIGELESERSAVAAEHDDAPVPFAARSGDREGLTGAPLWRLVRFADDVTPESAAGIEAALEAANLLDGWVFDGPAPQVGSEQFLEPLPAERRPGGRTLADVLVAEPDAGVAEQRVRDLLASIALTPADESVAVAVDADGRFRQGVQVGRHAKAHAEFIGTTARARRRQRRLADLDAMIVEARAAVEALGADRRRLGEQLTRLERAASALPRTGTVSAALRKVTECAGALRTATDSAAAADRDFDQALAEHAAREQQVRAAAVAHRTPHTARELDAVAAAIRHFQSQGQALLRARREHTAELERSRDAAVRLDEARRASEESAEQAAVAEESLTTQQQRLETLRDALGASAEQIDEQLERARERIETAKAAQRTARKAYDTAIERIGKAEAAHTAAEQTLRSTLVEALADAEHLAPYARPELLGLLGIEQPHAWPAGPAAWLDADQLVYRIQRDTDGAVPVLPAEVSALYGSLLSATESVTVSETARKSTRTALTSALQEFDAQLAAAGQDYRLHWDAPDGVTVVRVQDEQGFSSVGQFATRIAAARRDQELLLTDAERRILEDALLTGLAQQIHERTVDARALIAQMATEMRKRHMSSGNTIGVHWALADHLDDRSRAVCRLLDRDAS